MARVDTSQAHPRLAEVEILAATDVTAPLLGPNGASRLFGPQKGADPQAVEELEQALAYFAQGLSPEFIRVPGAGAAGGLGYGLAVLAGANIVSGYGLVAQALHLERRVAVADVVLTGEGRFDRQTALGKGPSALARSGKELGKPVVLFAGSVLREEGLDTSMFHEVIDMGNPALDKEAALRALQAAAAHWASTARHMKPHEDRDKDRDQGRRDEHMGSGSL
jgi:glycerate kinase